MKRFLITDWTNVRTGSNEEDNKPTIKAVYEKELWPLLQNAKEENLKIVIEEVGDCLIDWS